MKVNEKQLRRIIKEVKSQVLREQQLELAGLEPGEGDPAFAPYVKEMKRLAAIHGMDAYTGAPKSSPYNDPEYDIFTIQGFLGEGDSEAYTTFTLQNVDGFPYVEIATDAYTSGVESFDVQSPADIESAINQIIDYQNEFGYSY